MHPEGITQAEGSRKGHARQGMGWELEARSPVRLKCPVCRQRPQRPLSSRPSAPQGKAVLWGRGVRGWAGPAWSFYHHWVGSKVCGGSDHPLPASHFFSFCWPVWLFPEAAFPQRPLLAGWVWAWLHHTPSSRGARPWASCPSLGRLIGGKQPSSLLQNRKLLSLLPEGQELSP